MSQDLASQELAAGGGGGNATTNTGFATGTTCTRTGSYKATNKYLETIIVVAKGSKFPNGYDGKKTTWYALGATTTTSGSDSSGGFESVRVEAGAI